MLTSPQLVLALSSLSLPHKSRSCFVISISSVWRPKRHQQHDTDRSQPKLWHVVEKRTTLTNRCRARSVKAFQLVTALQERCRLTVRLPVGETRAESEGGSLVHCDEGSSFIARTPKKAIGALIPSEFRLRKKKVVPFSLAETAMRHSSRVVPRLAELSLPFAASEHFVAALAEVVFQQACKWKPRQHRNPPPPRARL